MCIVFIFYTYTLVWADKTIRKAYTSYIFILHLSQLLMFFLPLLPIQVQVQYVCPLGEWGRTVWCILRAVQSPQAKQLYCDGEHPVFCFRLEKWILQIRCMLLPVVNIDSAIWSFFSHRACWLSIQWDYQATKVNCTHSQEMLERINI